MTPLWTLSLALLAPTAAAHRWRSARLTGSRSPLGAAVQTPSANNCSWRVFNQTLDHFGGAAGTFSQRLCVYDGFVAGAAATKVLFYVAGRAGFFV